jgi:hypothetical protein
MRTSSVVAGIGACMALLASDPAWAALITTTISGDLIFEALEGHGGKSNQEFGLGTPSINSTPAQRDSIFTLHLDNDQLVSTTPSAVVDKGFFPAGSALDFYELSDFLSPLYAFSSALGGSPSPSDLVVFRDKDNSLGLGGSVVEVLGVDDWKLHLDDAASVDFDDDDNELVIRVHVQPIEVPQQVPEPGTLVMLGAVLLLSGFRSIHVVRPLCAAGKHGAKTGA